MDSYHSMVNYSQIEYLIFSFSLKVERWKCSEITFRKAIRVLNSRHAIVRAAEGRKFFVETLVE